MAKLFSGIFLMIGGLVAFYVISAFTGELNTTSWAPAEVTLITVVLPAVIIGAIILAAYMGVRGRIRHGGDRFDGD